MAELVNKLSWSKSRHGTLQDCPRRYWFQYYGSWGGWKGNADPRTREIYILKQLKTRPMWIGEVVHAAIEHGLKNLRRGIGILPPEKVIEVTIQKMRAQYDSSRKQVYRTHPKSTGLFEHEYGIPVSDAEWQETAESARTCLRRFYASPIFRELQGLAPEAWLGIEETETFEFDGVPVWVVMDCCHRTPEGIRILDWKTGRSDLQDNSIQLACYALYAQRRWDVPPEAIDTVEYNLFVDEARTYRIDREKIESIEDFIRASLTDMRSLLTDPETNTPLPEERFVLTENERICRRCNYRAVCPRFAAPGGGGASS